MKVYVNPPGGVVVAGSNPAVPTNKIKGLQSFSCNPFFMPVENPAQPQQSEVFRTRPVTCGVSFLVGLSDSSPVPPGLAILPICVGFLFPAELPKPLIQPQGKWRGIYPALVTNLQHRHLCLA